MIAHRVMGEVIETRWRCIAASITDDGGNEILSSEELGRVTVERRAYFAFRHEAEAWLTGQEGEGFARRSLSSAATFYHGPTDADGNCWSASVEKDERE